MSILMFFLLVFFVIAAYKINDKNLISPGFLLCLALLASYVVILLNYENWEVNVNENFVIYVSTGIITFLVGTKFSTLLYTGRTDTATLTEKLPLSQAGAKRKYPVNALMVVSLILSAAFVLKLWTDAGDGGTFNERLRRIYENIVNEGYSPGFIFNQFREIIVAIAYVSTFRLLQKFYSENDNISVIKLLVPVAAFVVVAMFVTDRNIFIRYAIYLVVLYVLFFSENYKRKNVNSAIIKRVILIVVVCAVIFFLMGLVKQYRSNFTRALSIYGGSGLYNFNLWIADGGSVQDAGNGTFATLTQTINYLLNVIGIEGFGGEAIVAHGKFIIYAAANGYVYSSNIYSAFLPFVKDLGYFGVILYPFILGAIFQLLFLSAQKYKYGFSWLLYALLIYPVIYFPIAEQFFGRMTLGFVYELMWPAIIYYIVYGRKTKESNTVRQPVSKERCDEKR